MENNREPQRDPPEPADAPGAEDGAERDKAVGEGGDKDKEDEEKDKEEEEAFLVSLYKFMKERRTPIERIPHLGFKQINLWKIYKAVEKLGAYELVTGRRLWKNVYDELGGSPGSTSAATCTRRHYERLVLPYVRHLKGEEDKPLPPSKPRRQYKVSKDDKSKRARREKGREQLAPDKAQPEAAERGRGTDGRSSPAPSPSGGCPSPCRSHSETYKRLFSSFYSKGNHPIMSPLAKKKLLAQVSKAESLPCHKRHCPEGRRAPSQPGPEPAEQRSPEAPGAPDRAPDRAASAGSEAGAARSASPGGSDSRGCPRPEGAAPAVFTGYFHAYRSGGPQPGGCPPPWGCLSSLKDLWEPPELRGRAWRGRPAAVQACWVPPGHGREEQREEEEEEEEEEEDEEEPFGPAAHSRAVSPLAKEGRDGGSRSPRGHQVLAKPKAVVATAGFAAPPPPDAFNGAALPFPGVPGVPLVIPAFPSPLVVAPELCRPLATGAGRLPASYAGSSARPRLYPAAPWHGQRSCSSPHGFPGRP